MAVVLNIAAIGFGILAFRFGPERHRAMIASGVIAAIMFVSSTFLYAPSKDYDVECNRYSKFSEDC